jgi:hypothetical protein
VRRVHKARDRLHYEGFRQFHASFYRTVEATSVTPWAARAIDRALAPTVVALARLYPGNQPCRPSRRETGSRPGSPQRKRAAALVPLVEPHHKYRPIGKIEHRSGPVVPNELAKPYLVFGHAFPLQVSALPNGSSISTDDTCSTSRIEREALKRS